MEKIIISLLAALLIVVVVLLSTLVGAFVGWLVGLFFDETILGIFACLGITGFKMWQIGAFLGFVSGFFRSSISSKRSED